MVWLFRYLIDIVIEYWLVRPSSCTARVTVRGEAMACSQTCNCQGLCLIKDVDRISGRNQGGLCEIRYTSTLCSCQPSDGGTHRLG